ncbi:NACHT domain protein [Plectosphaerella cucumerina]|uniref:NACHT domain protein n=1 Tax=Plectosphaerella cucumerina TaxID=40658 RepID=A0A8K0TQW6_9PEZI|nr:NACHT domain protein [Plectosphaerella cucumerina]
MPKSRRSGPALQVLQTARKNFESKLSGLHVKDFSQTTLEDARQGVLETEAQMAARDCLRNTRRLMPLFEGLHHYSKAVEVLCNGVPFMPLIWAPIKFIVNVTCENVQAFDKIIGQYSRIGEALVRFKLLQDTFVDIPEFQQIVVVFYSDILEFNGEAYKFVTRSSWELFFLTSWGRFERRFESIMENLKAHEKLLDNTANALNISEARRQREALSQEKVEKLAKVANDEKIKHASLYEDVSTWLKVDDTEQALIFDSITQEVSKYPGICDWIIQHDRIRSWLRADSNSGFLWLQGSPGSGKTTIANQIVAFLQKVPDSIVVRHFCDALTPASTNYDSILRSILFQLVRTNEDLIAYIHNLKTSQFLERTVTSDALEEIIRNTSGAVRHNNSMSHSIHIIIDGLDVCENEKQKRLIWLLERLVSPSAASACSCKVLLVSRRTELLRKRLRILPKISLNDEVTHITRSIESYARQRFGFMRRQLHELGIDDAKVKDLSQKLAAKAEAMFLWARLVLNYISGNLIYHRNEIENAIKILPRELEQFYEKILLQTISNFDQQSVDRLASMLGWILYSKRPLKKIELQSAITFAPGNPQQEDVVPSFVLGLCSQLVEERPDSTLALIHSSVKEYLQSPQALLPISEQSALLEHTTASMTLLLSATRCFSSGEVDERRQQQLVLSGLYAFQLYAQEYWVDTVLAMYSRQSTALIGDTLQELMGELCSRLEAIHRCDRETALELPVNDLTSNDSLLRCIQHLPMLHWAGVGVLKARSLGSRAKGDHTLATGPMNPLEKVLSRYQAIVRDLLSRQNVTGTSLDKLASFRKTHRDFAYTCRLGGCRRKAVGFETEKLRDQHEEAHRPVLRCEADGCQYPAFPSVNALRRHVKDLHTETRKYRSIRRTNAEKMPGDVRQPFSLVMAGPKSPPPAMIPRQAASHPAMMEDDGFSYQPTSWDESQQRSLRPFGEDTKIKPISWPSKFQGVSDRSSEPIPKEEGWFLDPIFGVEDWFPQEKLELDPSELDYGSIFYDPTLTDVGVDPLEFLF